MRKCLAHRMCGHTDWTGFVISVILAGFLFIFLILSHRMSELSASLPVELNLPSVSDSALARGSALAPFY